VPERPTAALVITQVPTMFTNPELFAQGERNSIQEDTTHDYSVQTKTAGDCAPHQP
jgi:hypothetical protein